LQRDAAGARPARRLIITGEICKLAAATGNPSHASSCAVISPEIHARTPVIPPPTLLCSTLEFHY
jgi:hypothetical protein